MKTKLFLFTAVCAVFAASAVGCSLQSQSEQTETASTAQTSSATSTATSSAAASVSAASSQSQTTGVAATLYIGTDDTFTQTTRSFAQAPAAAQLISAIEDETGWNLAVSEITTSGRGGYLIRFSGQSALFTDDTAAVKPAFRMTDQKQRAKTILDSIQKTFQANLAAENQGNQTLPIYYAAQNGSALTFPDFNVTIPLEEAYSPQLWEQQGQGGKG